jgi:hypothetical protein
MTKFNRIVGTFTKTITKLEKLAENNANDAEFKLSNIAQLESDVEELSVEATQASLLAKKLSEFLEV